MTSAVWTASRLFHRNITVLTGQAELGIELRPRFWLAAGSHYCLKAALGSAMGRAEPTFCSGWAARRLLASAIRLLDSLYGIAV